MQKENKVLQNKKLKQILIDEVDLELAILIGSQAKGNATQNSDWDIAIRWINKIEPLQRIIKSEKLRRLLAKQLQQPETKIDLVDLTSAKLAIRAVVAEDGLVLKGEDSLIWIHFLQHTWRELESFYWDKIYATRTLSS